MDLACCDASPDQYGNQAAVQCGNQANPAASKRARADDATAGGVITRWRHEERLSKRARAEESSQDDVEGDGKGDGGRKDGGRAARPSEYAASTQATLEATKAAMEAATKVDLSWLT